MALATTDDYIGIVGLDAEGVTVEELRQLAMLLDVGGAMVLAVYGQDIAEAVSTDVELVPVDGQVVFPQRPVTAVAEVTYRGDVLVEGVDYRWTPGGNGMPAYLLRLRTRGIRTVRDAWLEPVTVTYTHGWATIPAPIVAAVCFATQAAAASADDEGRNVTVETIDDFTQQFAAQTGTLPVPGWLEDTLERLLCVGPATSFPSVRV